MKNLQNNILKKIKSGELDMKPRWHFALKGLLLVLGVVLVTLIGIYLLSFVMFTLRQSGVGFIPLYGFRGLSQFVMSSPWLLIALAGAFVVLLQILVSKYSFSYRRPLLYSMIGVVLLVLISSYAIEQTVMHQRLQQFSEQHNVPVFTPMYRGIQENRPDNIIFGTITDVTETGFVIDSDRGETLTIVVTNDTKQRPGTSYEPEGTISVFGERVGDTVTAIGIRPAPGHFDATHRDRIQYRGGQSASPSVDQPDL